MDRDGKIATFQEISGIDNVGVALQLLETHNWDLERALETALAIGPENIIAAANLEANYDRPTSGPHSPVQQQPQQRIPQQPNRFGPDLTRQNINIEVGYLDTSYALSFGPDQTIGDLKETLEAVTGVPEARQMLLGDMINNPENERTFSQLNLQSGAHLYLMQGEATPQRPPAIPVHENAFAALAAAEAINRANTLGSDEDDQSSDEEYIANEDENSDSHISEGDNFGDDIYYDDGDNYVYDEDEDDDYYNPDDVMNNQARRPSVDPLIDQDLVNNTEGAQTFAISFESRYGVIRPEWFLGTYHDAIAEARRRARPLLVYIHSDNAVEGNVFCQQSLCNPAVVELLRENFICWGWDITLGVNNMRLRDMTSTESGAVIPRGRINCPFCGVVVVGPDGVEVVDRFSYCSEEDLFERLASKVAELTPFLDDNRERNERMERERQVRLQEQAEIASAYQKSLEEDRRKEEQKRLEEEAERQRQLDDARKEQEEKSKIEQLGQRVLAQPEADTKEPVCAVRFRFPEGAPEDWRFLSNTATIHDLVVFAGSRGYVEDEYQLVTSYPKRVLNDMEQGRTLADIGLSAREQIHVQER